MLYRDLLNGNLDKDLLNPFTNEPIFEDCLNSTIRYFESIEEYEKCDKLLKLGHEKNNSTTIYCIKRFNV